MKSATAVIIAAVGLTAATSNVSTPAVQVQFIRDGGCDSSPKFTKDFVATGKCVRYDPKGTAGAQVLNLIDRTVNFSLYTDLKCSPSKAIFVQGRILPPGANECFGDSGINSKAVIVSLV